MDIKKNKQITKFSYYGFFKNLKFFEPYLFIYFINNGLSFFMIGILFSIKEVIIYLFEIPSGVIADYYGKKNELKFCFIMYIISFVLFFFGSNYIIMIFAMVFFGLGDAFRSGTHKAMIYEYLEQNNMFHLKNKVYGYTRSYSKLGSALSSFISIIIILNLDQYRTIFLFSVLPYIIDFLLINSYPENLNKKIETELSFRAVMKLMKKQIKSIFSNVRLNLIIINSSVYNSIYSGIKDYIQPVIVGFILLHIGEVTLGVDELTKITLGVLYGIFSIGSVIASRYSYLLNKFYSSETIMKSTFIIFALSLFFVAGGIRFDLPILVIIIYFFIYISKDLRKIHLVEFAGNNMEKEERATVMSYNNQLKSSFLIVISPVLGFIADTFSISSMFIIVGLFLFSTYYLFKYFEK